MNDEEKKTWRSKYRGMEAVIGKEAFLFSFRRNFRVCEEQSKFQIPRWKVENEGNCRKEIRKNQQLFSSPRKEED